MAGFVFKGIFINPDREKGESMTTGSVPTNPRDVLWKDSFNTYYDAYFDELLSEALIKRWMGIDFGVKILVAITATGSTVAGLTLWEKPELKLVWAVISLIAAVASIFHTTLVVDNLIKELNQSSKDLAVCRNKLEDFRHDLKMNPDFDVVSKDNEFKDLKNKYNECSNKEPRDWTLTDRLKYKVKDILNKTIHDQIQA